MSQRIHLDATPGLFHQVLHCHQGDVGRQFEIAVVTRDGYEIPSGATFKIQATKPSGLGFTVTGTAANNIISFTSTEDMTSEAGEIPTQLEIKSGNDVIYTSNFLLVCETNVHPSSVTDGSPEEIISEITLLVERAESAASTAGADAAAAAQARVDEMMNYLPTEVTNLKSEINQIYPVNVDVGETTAGYYIYLNGNPMGGDANSSVTDFVSVLPGHSIYVSNIYCTGSRCVCAYDKNKTLTRVLTSNTGDTPINVTLKRNEYYIRITVWKTNVPSVVYTDELALTDIAYLENRDATIETHFDREITEYQVLRGFYVASDGSYVGDDNSAIIDKIPIQSGKSFTVKDVVLAGSRSICAYDSNGDFVSVLTTNQGTTAKTFTYTNDGSYAYVSITQTISIRSEMPTIEYVDGFSEISDEAIGEKRSIFDSDFIPFWNGQVETGYVDFNGTSIVASGAYRHTPYIPVKGGRTIVIKNFCSAVVRYLFAYDEDKNIRYIPVAQSSGSVDSYEYQLPIDVYFVRYNLLTTQVNTTSIEYKDTDVYKWSRETFYSSIVEEWFRKTSNAISSPFATATTHPTITLIDDDTISVEAVQRYYNACVANDVKGGYAVLTANLENNTALKNLLLDYESAGFSMNIHAYSQVDAFNSGATRDIAVAEANFCKGLRQMREFGFLDYMYWCTPFGVSDSDIQDVARRHGIKCLIRSGINTAYVDTKSLSRFDIPRASLNPNDTALQQVEALVDKIALTNGWLLVTTHMADWGSDTSRFTDFVTYAKNKGCVFKTISEAWAERQYIFDLYSTL